jgi:hypothetical protein
MMSEANILILPVRLQIILAIRSQDRQISPFSDFTSQNSRYKDGNNQNWFLGVSSRSLQGIAERPLPCNHNTPGLLLLS